MYFSFPRVLRFHSSPSSGLWTPISPHVPWSAGGVSGSPRIGQSFTAELPVKGTLPVYWENFYSISFQIEWDMVVMTVFHSILNQMKFHLIQNRKENCHHDHIPFNMKGNGNIVFSVHTHTHTHVMQPYAVIKVFFLCPSENQPNLIIQQPVR